jgi:hypothetical protein
MTTGYWVGVQPGYELGTPAGIRWIKIGWLHNLGGFYAQEIQDICQDLTAGVNQTHTESSPVLFSLHDGALAVKIIESLS